MPAGVGRGRLKLRGRGGASPYIAGPDDGGVGGSD
jgi:hypothetical protein